MILKKSLFFVLFSGCLIGSFQPSFPQNAHPFIKNKTILRADSLFHYNDDYEGSKRLFFKALKEIDKDDWDQLAYGYTKLSNVFTSLGNYSEAEKYLNRAHKIITSHLESDHPAKGEFHCYLGKYLLRRELFDSSLYHMNRSIELKRKQDDIGNMSLTESLFFKAELLVKLNIQSGAEKLYREIIDIYNEIFPDENHFYGRVYSSLASCLRQQFDFSNAIAYGKRSVQILRHGPRENPNLLATAMIILANIYTDYGEHESSVPLYLDILDKLHETDNELYYSWHAYSHLAQCYYQMGKFEEAENYLDQYINIINSENLGISILSFHYILYGDFYIHTREFDKARKYLFTAKKYYDNELKNEIRESIECYERIGNFYLELNRYDSALIYFQKTITKLVDDFSNEDIYANPVLSVNPGERKLYDLLYKKAGAFRKKFKKTPDTRYLNAALEVYRLIDDLNDNTRNSKLKDASLLLLTEYYRDEYEKAIESAFLLFNRTDDPYYIKEAFHFMEKSKYMLVFEALTLAEKSEMINLPDSIRILKDSLRMINEQYTALLDQEKAKVDPGLKDIQHLESKKFATEKALDELRIYISETFPEYYEIKYDSLTSSLNDFSNYCKKYKYTGIEYFWGKENIYSIGIDGDQYFFEKIPRTRELNSSIQFILKELSGTPDFKDASYIKFINNAHFAGKNLIGNLLRKTDRNVENLIIIPDGLLAQLPFEALLRHYPDSGYTDYSSLPYLITETTIQYVYSVNLMLTDRKYKRESSKKLIAFSYSDIDALSENGIRSTDNELPRSAVELNTIKKVMKGDNLFLYAEEATEYQFKTKAPEYSVLHLAVHGEADTTSAHNSKLIFKHHNDSLEDGTLFIHELYDIDLSGTHLAVLSACETGIGKEFSGEGVFSIARGFAYAGCPSIVMSLWKVSDEYTSELMYDFYAGLRKGKSTKEALREAKLKFLMQHNEYQAHPANWASFVMLGKDIKIDNEQGDLFWIASIIFAILVLLFLLIRFKDRLDRGS